MGRCHLLVVRLVSGVWCVGVGFGGDGFGTDYEHAERDEVYR